MLAEKSCEDRKPAEQRLRFEKIWQQHRARIWRLVARLAGNADLADDLTQEVCLRAFQSFDRFRGTSRSFTWLYRIAINVVNGHLSRRREETVSLDLPQAMLLRTSEAAGPETAALAGDLRSVIWSALERLPDDLRTTLILQVYEGLKYREIAAVLNIPMGTVASRVHNALERLREELNDYGM